MGVFKWLRRERVTVTTRHSRSPAQTPEEPQHGHNVSHSTIRTEEYKRDLAEFQARRSAGSKELQVTPEKTKCGRHSLPVSCTNCTMAPSDYVKTFNYEKKSDLKYKKKPKKRSRSASPEDTVYETLPNIQFLFQNQVFMPGNLFPPSSFSEPHNYNRSNRVMRSPDVDFLTQKHIDFKDTDQVDSPPMFYKNNSLPFDVNTFLECSKSDDEVDDLKAARDVNLSRQRTESPNKDGSDDKLWEVLSELKHFDQWADEQLQPRSPNMSKSDDSNSDISAYGLPIASSCNLDATIDKNKMWSQGKWGVVPVLIKKLAGVTIQHVKKKLNEEINILRKYRHPNIILLMGLYPDVHNNVHIICEHCVDSLFGILHVQGRILTAQTAVQYACDIASALSFLRMQRYVHGGLGSAAVLVTRRDAAKLADLGPCARLPATRASPRRASPGSNEECEPLISQRSSETYIASNAVAKDYTVYQHSESYQWQAPELFTPDEGGLVYPCSRSDVYSLCMILKESCDATLPWKNHTYDKVKEQYTLWKTGVILPQDGTYPGALLALLQSGLKIDRQERIDLNTLQNTLQSVKTGLDDLGYIIIPARLSHKKPGFSTTAWDTASPTDSDCHSPLNIQHKAIVHIRGSSTESEKECSKSDISPLYETIRKSHSVTCSVAEKCYISDDDNSDEKPILIFKHLPEKDFSSACSTPIAKIKARIKDMDTPNALHRSDSTEYCSILSPNRTHFGLNDDTYKDQNGIERSTAKLSRSFTPKSYKPLHIKVPEYNLDSIKPLLRDQNNFERSSYNFDIKNYSLPTTPIARSNKLRKNAWLSGDLSVEDTVAKTRQCNPKQSDKEEIKSKPPDMTAELANSSPDKDDSSCNFTTDDNKVRDEVINGKSPGSEGAVRDGYTGLKKVEPPRDFFSPETNEVNQERTNSWSPKSDRTTKYKVEEDILASVNVKPLVAIHERWIYEANKKVERSMSLPEDNRQIPAVKPASHCVDTLQKSLPQLHSKRPKIFRSRPQSPSGKHDHHWEQFCQARETIAQNVNFAVRDSDRFRTWKKDSEKQISSDDHKAEPMIDRATDTQSIEEFIRDMIRKEFQHYLQEIVDDSSTITTGTSKRDSAPNKGATNTVEPRTPEDNRSNRKDLMRSFSRVKINGNNKPLVQITFSRSGESSLQVLDSCVSVTLGDGADLNQSSEETLVDEGQFNSLKRCQAFNAIQEARSTEDLYIDDELSPHVAPLLGRLVPLHGSLHELLCERADCCLLRLQRDAGADLYLRCDPERDTVDGLVCRRVALLEEAKRITHDSRPRSASSPALHCAPWDDEVELNIESVVCYQDSSSDEGLPRPDCDDFELLERKIEEDLANSTKSSLTCGCLEKISEENLSVLNEE